MAELIRTTDVAMVPLIEGLLDDAAIPFQVADRNISSLEGAIMAFPMRVLVPDDREAEARQLMTDADLGHWLRPQDSDERPLDQ
ncbi:DUF2007 domain-containing protein [Nocardioides gilvus]|uniref:putative signal transducing protein n=1 Tax=Nocardioides gilvus TaxID=1735589 RepID=UPI000D749D0A|nr:DUF2007 domain-containing protein [Nocardioides gilvus]